MSRLQTIALLALGLAAAPGVARYAETEMESMLSAIVEDTGATARTTGVAEIDPRVMDAIRRVRREAFVPGAAARLAYANTPLGIGHGQTISQPFIVALMTHLLAVGPEDRVLEIGTGSGYQAAVLGKLVRTVHTIEIIPELAERAAATLARQGLSNVHVRTGDGWYGWPELAPFDAIIVTAVADEVPPRLLEQLAVGGRMVLPVGPEHGVHDLVVVTREVDGSIDRRSILPVRFVPLTGEH